MEKFQVMVSYFWIAVVFVVLLALLTSCANIKEWKKVVTEDKIRKIVVTEICYKEDTSFDLGTEGLGEYFLLKVEGF